MRVETKDIKLHVPYWVCDESMAAGRSMNNVFEYTFIYEDEIAHKWDYAVFTTETEALKHSAALDA